MSAKKDFETKLPEEENTDSGFLSGPLRLHSEELSSEDLEKDVDPLVDCDSKKVISDSSLDQELDSGIILSECLSKVKLSDTQPTPTAQPPPKVTVTDDDLLAVFFGQDDDGDTQLHISAVHGCKISVRTLITACPDKAWLDIANDFGHTALHLSVMSNNEVVTRMLVKAGACLGARDYITGNTPIHIATEAKNEKCLHALLYMPDNVQEMRSYLNQKNYNGQTCVHIAAAAGDIDTLRILLYYGADINAKEGLCGWSALHMAARRGDEPLVRFLLEQCPAPVAVSARDYAGRTPRRLARHHRHLRAAFDAAARRNDSDTDYSDTDDELDLDDNETGSLFERIRDILKPMNVA